MQQLKVEESRHSSLLCKERTLAAMLRVHESSGDGPSERTPPERLALQTQQHLQARAQRAISPQPSTSTGDCGEADLHLLANVAATRRLGQTAPRQLALLEQLHPSGWPARGSAVERVLQRVGPHAVLWSDAEVGAFSMPWACQGACGSKGMLRTRVASATFLCPPFTSSTAPLPLRPCAFRASTAGCLGCAVLPRRCCCRLTCRCAGCLRCTGPPSMASKRAFPARPRNLCCRGATMAILGPARTRCRERDCLRRN